VVTRHLYRGCVQPVEKWHGLARELRDIDIPIGRAWTSAAAAVSLTRAALPFGTLEGGSVHACSREETSTAARRCRPCPASQRSRRRSDAAPPRCRPFA
jgi:hypothetical protein